MVNKISLPLSPGIDWDTIPPELDPAGEGEGGILAGSIEGGVGGTAGV